MKMIEARVIDDQVIAFNVIPSEDAAAFWPNVKDHCQDALLATFSDIPVDRVLELIVDGTIILVVVTIDDEIRASMTCEIIDTCSGKSCHIVTIGGEDLERWASDWLPVWIQIAREQGCSQLTVKGREGWARYGRKFGFVHQFTQMKLDISEVQ